MAGIEEFFEKVDEILGGAEAAVGSSLDAGRELHQAVTGKSLPTTRLRHALKAGLHMADGADGLQPVIRASATVAKVTAKLLKSRTS